MAEKDRKSPAFCEGQLWKQITDKFPVESAESDDDLTENETMKLRKEDMPLFGLYPAWDDFYLVVCEFCGQVIKPQALKQHIELRHSYHDRKNSTHSSTNSIKMHPSKITANGTDVSSVNSILNCKEVEVDEKLPSVIDDDTPKQMNTQNVVLTLTPDSTPENNEKCALISNSDSNSTLFQQNGPVTCSETSPNVSIFKELNVEIPQPEQKTPAKKKSSKKAVLPSSRKLLPCKDREYDANKHCGVCLPEMDKPCTRSLTCKTHSLTLRRAVPGRTKIFDELLAEHRAAKEALMRAQGLEVKPRKKPVTQQQKLQLKQQLEQQKQGDSQKRIPQTTDINKVSRPSSTSSFTSNHSLLTTLITTNTTTSLLHSQPHQKRLESVKSHNLHPKPVALCTFNCRKLPQICSRTFGRSWDLTIATLQKAVNVNLKKPDQVVKNNMTNSTVSTQSHQKSASRSNQFPVVKKLCVELTPLEMQSSQNDPYNFLDTTSYNNNFTYTRQKNGKIL